MPSRVERRLLGELLPICAYVQASYRPGRYISVRWVDGPQTYDAELEQRGAYVSENFYPATGFLEVTSAMHPNEYLGRELLEKEGFAFGVDGLSRRNDGSIESVPVSYTNREFVGSFSKIVLGQIAKKERKPYPTDTALIVHCTMNLPYLPDEWTDLVGRIRSELPASRFREIFLYDSVGPHTHRIFPQQLPNVSSPV